MAGSTTHHRIANLDGLRGVAITGVLIGHFLGSPGLPEWTLWLARGSNLLGLDCLGVQLFFLISGFIITHLLVKEERDNGSVNLQQFWARRAFRILPPLLAFLFGTLLISMVVPTVNPNPNEYWMALTFTRGWWDQGGWWLGHTWSLSIEEQFYVFWPLLFLAGGRYRLWLLLFVTAGLMLGVPCLLSDDLLKAQKYLLPANAIYLAAGCALAILWRGTPVPTRLLWLTPLLLLSGVLAQRHHLDLATSLSNAGGLAIALAVWVSNESAPGDSVLRHPATQWLGRISYSLYLWQQLFLGPYGTETWQTAPLNLSIALLAGYMAYRWIERPSLIWRKHLIGQ